jgi:hypothetical protein
MAAGVVQIPWYANVFRADKLGLALAEIAPIALRYGATEYIVYRSNDDRYKFLQCATFDDKVDFERYWYGEEFAEWRADYSGWYQVPVLYVWNSVVVAGSLNDRSAVS